MTNNIGPIQSNTVSLAIAALVLPSAPVLSGETVADTNTLEWTASTAGTYAVAGYRLYNADGDTLLADVALLTFDDEGLDAGDYNYYVVAYDTQDNESAHSNTVGLTVADGALVLPSAPVLSDELGGDTASLSWTASTAGSWPIAGYRIYQDGALVATVTSGLVWDSGALAEGIYDYTVVAIDIHGNTSTSSNTLSIYVDPYWSNVVTLLHGEGANNGTVFTDEKAKSYTRSGNTVTSTAQKKFGAASLAFDGSQDWLVAAASSDFVMNVDFTGECWVRFNAVSSTPHIMLFSNGTNLNRHNVFLSGGAIYWYYERSGPVTQTIGGPAIAINTWYHVALVKSGSVVSLYVDGTLAGQVTLSAQITMNLDCVLGHQKINNAAGDSLNGYIDEFRYTKGVARYSSDFSPYAHF